jgi:hypothetical protein
LQVRVASLPGADTLRADLKVTTALLPEPFAERLELRGGESREFVSPSYQPVAPGTAPVHCSLTLADSAELPLGRWQGSHVLTVEAVARRKDDNIFIDVNAGKMVIPGVSSTAGSVSVPQSVRWERLDLQPDRVYLRWVEQTCPVLPPCPVPAGHRPPPSLALLRLRDSSASGLGVVAVAVGASATLGRGGPDSGVTWWVKPAPPNDSEADRLSRRHLRLDLADGRAWLTDHSTNHTWLTQGNGRTDWEMTPDRKELLAAGDLVRPAGLKPLRVGLAAARGKVHAAWLERTDALAGSVVYLLTTGLPVPLPLPAGESSTTWIAWLAGPDGSLRLAVRPGEKPIWYALDAGRAYRVGRLELTWRLLAAPLAQDEMLGA